MRGLYSAYGILSAYIHQDEERAMGQFLEVSIMEAALAYTVWESASYFATGQIPPPSGIVAQVVGAVSGFADFGWAYYDWRAESVELGADGVGRSGREDLLEDERYADNAGRLLNQGGVGERTWRRRLGRGRTDEWCEVLDKAGVPAGSYLQHGAGLG